MKKYLITILVFVLALVVFVGCRDMNNTTTKTPATSATTQTTLLPSPDITLPVDEQTTAGGRTMPRPGHHGGR